MNKKRYHAIRNDVIITNHDNDTEYSQLVNTTLHRHILYAVLTN